MTNSSGDVEILPAAVGHATEVFELARSLAISFEVERTAFDANFLLLLNDHDADVMVAERDGLGSALMHAFERSATRRNSRLIALATRRADDFYQQLDYEASATYYRRRLPD